MTRKEKQRLDLEWNRAIAEGRVVRHTGGFRSFPTVEQAQAYLVTADGLRRRARIVDPSLVQL